MANQTADVVAVADGCGNYTTVIAATAAEPRGARACPPPPPHPTCFRSTISRARSSPAAAGGEQMVDCTPPPPPPNDQILAPPLATVPPNNDKRHVIHIKRGVYKEFIFLGLEKCNVVLIGADMEAAVISGSRCCADGFNTSDTAVLIVQGKGFVACDLCIENTAGPRKEQGQTVALLSESDQSVLYRCSMRGGTPTGAADGQFSGQANEYVHACRDPKEAVVWMKPPRAAAAAAA
ncbi:hypothetical protein C2845_PM03G01790 [Panicum miliaceum]|uniref:Pectinesterase n=1 Tax=Panicum miliaceum TaxID=4540 RepID=A0A3L6TG16_PANMI|nr:hypothetical protein C2845_PM03G01790 [Panicum miliaceum]